MASICDYPIDSSIFYSTDGDVYQRLGDRRQQQQQGSQPPGLEDLLLSPKLNHLLSDSVIFARPSHISCICTSYKTQSWYNICKYYGYYYCSFKFVSGSVSLLYEETVINTIKELAKQQAALGLISIPELQHQIALLIGKTKDLTLGVLREDGSIPKLDELRRRFLADFLLEEEEYDRWTLPTTIDGAPSGTDLVPRRPFKFKSCHYQDCTHQARLYYYHGTVWCASAPLYRYEVCETRCSTSRPCLPRQLPPLPLCPAIYRPSGAETNSTINTDPAPRLSPVGDED